MSIHLQHQYQIVIVNISDKFYFPSWKNING